MSNTFYSREDLRSMLPTRRKQLLFQLIDSYATQAILNSAKHGSTKHFWTNIPKYSNNTITYQAQTYSVEELVEGLKEKFPDTTVEHQETYVETKPGIKELKKGILIDWS